MVVRGTAWIDHRTLTDAARRRIARGLDRGWIDPILIRRVSGKSRPLRGHAPARPCVCLRREAITIDGDDICLTLGDEPLMLPGSVAELIMTFVAHPCYRRNMAALVTRPGCDALSALAGAYYLPHIRPASLRSFNGPGPAW